ncbi:unnamed protein product, partial [Allacma fusca]
ISWLCFGRYCNFWYIISFGQ